MLRQYYLLTKPGIIRGNLFTALAGFFLASHGNIDFTRLFFMAFGIGLVIASGCVFNNYIDRIIDSKMERTKARALVTGKISQSNAIFYGLILGMVGFLSLLQMTTITATVAALIGFVFYVVIYAFAKRKSEMGTVVGSISGAVPPVVGYTAVTNKFDLGALLLLLVLVAWQMPHFYSIAIFRLKEYKEAGIPVLPSIQGMRATKIQIIFYVIAFIIISTLFYLLGLAGLLYFIVMLTLGGVWLVKGLAGFSSLDDNKWGRMMFGYSLLVLTSFCVLISIGTFLPFGL